MPTPVIPGCDLGHDDVLALRLAAGTPEIDVLQGAPEGPLHDTVAVAIATDRAVVTVQRSHVDVETRGELTSGATAVDLHDVLHEEAGRIAPGPEQVVSAASRARPPPRAAPCGRAGRGRRRPGSPG